MNSVPTSEEVSAWRIKIFFSSPWSENESIRYWACIHYLLAMSENDLPISSRRGCKKATLHQGAHIITRQRWSRHFLLNGKIHSSSTLQGRKYIENWENAEFQCCLTRGGKGVWRQLQETGKVIIGPCWTECQETCIQSLTWRELESPQPW